MNENEYEKKEKTIKKKPTQCIGYCCSQKAGANERIGFIEHPVYGPCKLRHERN